MNITTDYIPAGRRNRPATNPASSLYKKPMAAKYLTIHNAGSDAPAERLHRYLISIGAANRPASWHFSIDEKDCYQGLPLNEPGFHAGDNLGPGNTTTIGIEICDYAIRAGNTRLYMQAEDNAARLCAWLIKQLPSLHPFPQCMKQHFDWSGKNCPSWIRGRANGWQEFISKVEEYLKVADDTKPIDPNLYYRVIIGSYRQRANADRALAEAKAKGFDNAFIVAFRRDSK